jgi:terminase large subunit-like protein
MTAVTEKPIYDPAPIQQEVHLCSADEILVGGAAGGTKSMTLLMDPVQTQVASEHTRWLKDQKHRSLGWAIHFRREFPMLKQTIERSHRIYRSLDPGAHWNMQDHMWTFSCGYKVQFGHLKNDDDRFNYLSNEYSAIYFDELCEFSKEVYDLISTRLRSSDPVLQKRLRLVSATNPSGNWVRDYFVAPAPEGRKLLTRKIRTDDGNEHAVTRIFIPATLKDNPDPNFRASYELQLQKQPAHLRRAYLYGDWWVVPGAFFAEEWVPGVHVVPPFKIPSGWVKFRSMDWGYKSRGTVGWYAVDTDENLVKYREFSFRKMDAGEVADAVREIERKADEWDEKRNCSRLTGPADTQIWETRGTIGPTIAESMMDAGVYWEKCTKNKRAAVHEFMSRLKDRSGEKGIPGFRCFDTCKNTARTIPSIGTDKTDPELPDDSPGVDDHDLDETLYAVMYRARVPKHDEAPRSQSAEDELWEARKKKSRRAGAYGYGGH